MTELKSDPDLEDALTGLLNAAVYCENAGYDEEAKALHGLYQTVGTKMWVDHLDNH